MFLVKGLLVESYNIGERLKLVRETWQICDWEIVLEIDRNQM